MTSDAPQLTSVIISGLSPTTTEESLHNFFSFCGNIESISRQEKSATIKFENQVAAKTSLMLDSGTLDGATIQVKPLDGVSFDNLEPSSSTNEKHEHHQPGDPEAEEIKQEDKPRSAIAAEYLAHGYVLGDQAISKAISLDQKHGISRKFMSYFHRIQDKACKGLANSKTGGTDGVTVPQGAQQKLANLRTMSTQYYEKALNSPSGSKVSKFYTETSKQIFDVHAEAKRIAEAKLGHAVFASVTSPVRADTAAPSAPPAAPAPST